MNGLGEAHGVDGDRITAPVRPRDAVAAAMERIAADGRAGIWIHVVDRVAALAAARDVERRLAAGERLPLAGLTLAVKDNIDVAGIPTTAGCPAYAYVPALSAPVVRALVDAGAVVVGKTNLDQFATGLVGVRSPYGICPNARWPRLVAGGSSAGSAVAVAAGMVDLALGTDTAGSGRVPAACNGIVGLKPTRGRISTAGVVPACHSVDCVSVFARDVDMAAAAVAIAALTSPDIADPWSRSEPMLDRAGGASRLRLGVPRAAALDFDGDPSGADRFGAAVDRVAGLDVELVPIDLEPFLACGRLLYGASFVAERYEAVGAFIDAHPDDVDPVVAAIISAAGRLPAWQVFRDQTELRRLARFTAPAWTAVDAIVLPTVPRVPSVTEVLQSPIERNSMLGTYTSFVNLLDLCALTVPVDGVGAPDLPPPSISFVAPAWADDLLVTLGRRLRRGTPSIPRSA